MSFATKPLGELCEILDSRRKPITKRDRKAGLYPYYGATGIQDHVAGFIFDEPLVLVGEDGAKWGSGEITAFPVAGKIWVNNHAHVLRPDRKRLLDRWLIHFLNYSDLTDFVSGLTVPKLNQASLREIPVPVPAVPEQHRIVAILDEAFAGIATTKANADRSLHSAREAFDAALSSRLGGSGKWAERKLGDICEIARGGSPRPIKSFLTDADDGINWIKIGDASASSKYIYRTKEKIKPSGVSRSRMVHDGDFILSNSMSFGRPYIMRTSGCIHDGWLVLSGYETVFDQDFLYLLLGSQYVYQQFDSLAAGSTVRNLNIELASRVNVPVPPLETQRTIANELDALEKETSHLESLYTRKLAALDELRQSLLQQAFSGQL